MTSRDKLGVGILVGLFALLGTLLVWTFSTPGGASNSIEESALVKQRMINIQKGR
jgi:hypothetical protein